MGRPVRSAGQRCAGLGPVMPQQWSSSSGCQLEERRKLLQVGKQSRACLCPGLAASSVGPLVCKPRMSAGKGIKIKAFSFMVSLIVCVCLFFNLLFNAILKKEQSKI